MSKGRGKRRAGGDKFRYRHRKAIMVLLTLVIVLGGSGAAWAYVLNSKLNNVPSVAGQDKIANRPDPDKGKALNILLLGSDAGQGAGGGNTGGASIKVALAKKTWPVGAFRSDTMMIVHISANRKSVSLVSIPRDTRVKIYDALGTYRSQNKANASMAFYGPNGTLSTIENLSGIRMNHMVIVDWEGFRDLSTALGGVEVCIPESFYDSGQNIQWEAGCQKVQGKNALAYVRTRHGLANGDFGRIQRQQNFLRATMEGLLSKSTFTNPIRLTNVLSAVTENIVIDEDWEGGDIRALALSMRKLSSKNVTFLTLPISGEGNDATSGAYQVYDEAKSAELFAAVKADRMAPYLKKYPDDALGDPTTVK
ncbi:LCP family protein [soil metagenome]